MSRHSTQTFLLAKSYYNISNAIRYLTDIKSAPKVSPYAKTLVSAILIKLEWCIKTTMANLGPEAAASFRQELLSYDTVVFDSIFDQLVMLTQQQREEVEDIIIAYRKGELKISESEPEKK